MRNILVRDTICRTLWSLGITRPSRFVRGRLLVITFHRVLPEQYRREYPYPGLVVTPDELDWLCGLLKEHFHCGAFTESYGKWLSSSPTDKPYLAITFDDGQRDNYEHARPILAKHRLHATFYIPVQPIDEQRLIWHDRLGFAAKACAGTNSGPGQLLALARAFGLTPIDTGNMVNDIVEKAKGLSPTERQELIERVAAIVPQPPPPWSEMMSWSELQQMVADGHEIGSHSMTHALMPHLTDEELNYEAAESRRRLEQRLGIAVRSFCFPNGDNDLRTRQAVERAGYSNAVTTRWGLNNPTTGRFLIKRCDMDAHRLLDRHKRLSPPRLFFRLSGLQPGLR